jgi:hypothetical protein
MKFNKTAKASRETKLLQGLYGLPADGGKRGRQNEKAHAVSGVISWFVPQ